MLRRASELIDSDGEITVVHVAETVPHYVGTSAPTSEDLDWMIEVEDKLKSLCARLDIEAAYVVKVGRVAPTILDVAHERSADLIIVGSHIQDITDALFGSIVDRIIRGAASSVLVDRH